MLGKGCVTNKVGKQHCYDTALLGGSRDHLVSASGTESCIVWQRYRAGGAGSH